jgi:hypothetical protein
MREEIDALPPRAAALAGAWVDRVETRLARARVRAGEPVAPFRVAKQVARDLARELDRHGLLRKDFAVAGIGCCHEVDDDGEARGRRRAGRLSSYARFMRRIREARGRGGAEGGHAVGRLRIARPALTIRQPSVLRAGMSQRRFATEGTQIARPDRFALDRAIFARRGRGGGGTILVDTSGSMRLRAADVEEIVRSAGGAAVVAIYSGRGDEGELRIVARGDWRVASEDLVPFGGGNVVDLPALQWLAKQPTPRCWISDGHVTGVDDHGCPIVLERCQEVAARAGITRHDDAKTAIEALRARSGRP